MARSGSQCCAGAASGGSRTASSKSSALPRKEARPYNVAVDRDGNVWYTDIRGFVGMLPAADAKR